MGSGRQREHAVVFDMEDLHDRNAACLGAIDQRLLAHEERRRIVVAPVRALAKRFLTSTTISAVSETDTGCSCAIIAADAAWSAECAQ